MSTRVLLVDDHEVVRDGLRRMADGDTDLEVVGDAGCAATARDALEALQPDVALIDVVLPDGDGIQLCREAATLSPGTSCVLLTSFPESRAKLSAAVAGAAAYLTKGNSSAAIRRVVHDAAAGERLMDGDEIQTILDHMAEQPGGDDTLPTLTPQQRRAFELIGQGLSNREIGEQLQLTERTVKNYVSRMLDKLDMSRRTEAAALAARLSERRAQRDARHAGATSQRRTSALVGSGRVSSATP